MPRSTEISSELGVEARGNAGTRGSFTTDLPHALRCFVTKGLLESVIEIERLRGMKLDWEEKIATCYSVVDV